MTTKLASWRRTVLSGVFLKMGFMFVSNSFPILIQINLSDVWTDPVDTDNWTTLRLWRTGLKLLPTTTAVPSYIISNVCWIFWIIVYKCPLDLVSAWTFSISQCTHSVLVPWLVKLFKPNLTNINQIIWHICASAGSITIAMTSNYVLQFSYSKYDY